MKLNLKLQELSEKENIVFIDLNKVLSENGKLKKSYSSKDDIHLNGDGYFAWKNSIKKYIQWIPDHNFNFNNQQNKW